MSGVADLLREEPTPEQEESDENLIECQGCGAYCKPDVEMCPECGEAVKLVTLGEWGAKLPIGIVDGNKLLKSFTVIERHDWKVDRAIRQTQQARFKLYGFRVSDYIGAVMAHTVKSIGDEQFTKHDVDKRMMILDEMFLGDVFYMYAYLRVQSMKNIFTLKSQVCPVCNKKFNYPVDLNTLEVDVRKSASSLNQEVEFEDGFELMGETRKKITLKPPLFRVFQISDEEEEAGAMAAEVLKSSLVSIEGLDPGHILTEAEIDGITKYDMAILDEAIDKMSGGPRWLVEVVCPNKKCHHEYDFMIDWTYEGFFRRSSQSRQRRRRSKR